MISVLPILILAGCLQSVPKSTTPVSFSKQIVPLLAANCNACHASNTPQSGLATDTYMALIRGGKRGKCIEIGNPNKSLIIQYLDGRRQPKMPIGGALKDVEIDVIKRWISEGAKLDTDSKQPVPTTKELKSKVSALCPVNSLVWSRDGKRIYVAGYKVVEIRDANTGNKIGQLVGHSDIVRSLALSPDGKVLAAAGGKVGKSGEVKLWILESGTSTTIEGHTDSIYGVAWRPDGLQIATASYDKTAKIWDVKTGKSVVELRDHTDAVFAVAYSSDSKYLATASADKSIKIWEGMTGKRMYSLSGAQEAVMSLAFMPKSSRLYSAGADKVARAWDLRPDGGGQVKSNSGQADAILDLCLSEDGTMVLTASMDGSVHVVKENDGASIKILPGSPEMALSVKISPNGELFAAGWSDGRSVVFRIKDGTQVAVLTGNPTKVDVAK